MAVTFTLAQSMLVTQANALALEATTAGLTALSTALTNLATEIAQSVTEREFFGGGTYTSSGSGASAEVSGTENGSAALVWSKTLDLAANIIKTKNSSAIKTSLGNIESNIDAITTDIDAITTDIDTITSNSTSIKTAQETMAQKQTAIETYQKKLKELGEGPGIHVVGPYELLGLVSIYRLFIEQGKMLETTNNVSSEQQAQALATFQSYVAKFNSLPKF